MRIKHGFNFKFNSGQFSGQPTELPTIFILERSGLPTELPTELPNISLYGRFGQPYLHGKIPMGISLRCPLSQNMEVVGSLIRMAKFPWEAHEQPTELPTFSYLEAVGFLLSCPLRCPLFPYMEVVGNLICMAKFPLAAHGQPTPLPMCCPCAEKWAAPLLFLYGLPYNFKIFCKI